MLVGIKPTVGRISRYGVIPIAADQDTAGPMARSVAAPRSCSVRWRARSPIPTATSTCTPPQRDYTKFPRREGLKSARLGIPRGFYYDAAVTPGERGSTGGLNEAQKRVMTEAIAAMRSQGATIVDPTTGKAATRIARWCSRTG